MKQTIAPTEAVQLAECLYDFLQVSTYCEDSDVRAARIKHAKEHMRIVLFDLIVLCEESYSFVVTQPIDDVHHCQRHQ